MGGTQMTKIKANPTKVHEHMGQTPCTQAKKSLKIPEKVSHLNHSLLSTHRGPVQDLEVLRVGNVPVQQLALDRAQRQFAPRAEYYQIDITEI